MKRILCILFALCSVITLSLSVSAESTNKLTYAVEASASTVSANTEFTLLVKVTENTGICWAKAVVSYDSSVLTYIDYSTDQSVFKSTITANNPKDGEVVVTLGGISVLFAPNPTVFTDKGVFVALTFRVNENAKAGDTVVSVKTSENDVVKIVNSVPNYDYKITNASTTVKVNAGSHKCTPAAAVKENEVPATCLAEGHYDMVVYCTSCGGVISRETKTIAKTSHVAGAVIRENVKEATCLATGSYDEVTKCTYCQTEMSRKKVELPKTDHKPGESKIENLKDATCIQQGSYDLITYCSICKAQLSKTNEIIEFGPHTPGATNEENRIAPTCAKAGSYEIVTYCKVCSKEASREKKEIPALEHVKGNSVKENQKAATCAKEGSYDEVVYCTVCKGEVARVTVKIPKTEHTPGNAKEENRKAPVNCGADGTYDSVVYCSVCKIELSRITQSIPAPAHKPGPAATATTPQICTVCNKVLAPKLDHVHNWASSWTKDAVGHWHTCSGCDNKNNYEEHHYTNGCDADCNICGASRAVVGHQYDNDCDDTCNKCNEKRTIVGHTYDNNCDGTCNTCGAQRPVTHTYDNNCDAICNICNTPRVAADHVYGSWNTVKEATATTDGQRERTCNICGNKQTEVIPATGSTADTTVTTTEPTPGTSGSEVTTEKTPGPEATEPNQTEDPGVEDPGCGSVVSMGIAIIAILGTALIMKKRD